MPCGLVLGTHPPRDRNREAMQGCSWPHPLGRNSLRDGKELPSEAMGFAEGCRSNESRAEGTLLGHPCLPAAGQGGPASIHCIPRDWSHHSRLAQLRPLDVCTFLPVNVSRNQKLLGWSITPPSTCQAAPSRSPAENWHPPRSEWEHGLPKGAKPDASGRSHEHLTP